MLKFSNADANTLYQIMNRDADLPFSLILLVRITALIQYPATIKPIPNYKTFLTEGYRLNQVSKIPTTTPVLAHVIGFMYIQIHVLFKACKTPYYLIKPYIYISMPFRGLYQFW